METPSSRDAGLGDFIAEYRQDNVGSIVTFFVQVSFFGGVALLLLAAELPGVLFPWLYRGGLGILIIVGAGQSVAKIITEWGRVILLYQKGLVEIKQNTETLARWEDCGYIRSRYGRYNRYTGTSIKLVNGYEISFDTHLRKVRELTQHVEVFMSNEWLPIAVEAIKDGDTLTFGGVKVSKTHVERWRGISVGWERVQEVRLKRNQIELEIEGRLLTAILHHRGIPNSLIFVELIKHIAKSNYIPIQPN